MQSYLWFAGKRLLQLVAVIFFGVSAMFLVTYLSPIDPVEQVLGGCRRARTCRPKPLRQRARR